VREETQDKQSICVFCGKPIAREQRPSVQMQRGKEAHVECWQKHEQDATKCERRRRAAGTPRTLGCDLPAVAAIRT